MFTWLFFINKLSNSKKNCDAEKKTRKRKKRTRKNRKKKEMKNFFLFFLFLVESDNKFHIEKLITTFCILKLKKKSVCVSFDVLVLPLISSLFITFFKLSLVGLSTFPHHNMANFTNYAAYFLTLSIVIIITQLL